ncbi:uncharacterized protein LOC130014544 [Mercurialis annua]|uniref:uncharacterized protein LOC126665666 n=1 Tax=Mercurialis annua TaxID=3986 RepID=UPI00215F8738|nr:uncharacterized protein LOC126665666 [Mercurialis annua]XP_050214487.1 uncharacterized protein LOC126665666 [Mercurialis annua]XP_050214491.2 uncharacterized protein LOC126665666 [Mercurialis annua]XP_055962098.1 uncharacterized protein LOC130014544 [Mercurialis annua]XP_055962099.1 uncharacterized protein LOC130014544 [Mercurialis annua]
MEDQRQLGVHAMSAQGVEEAYGGSSNFIRENEHVQMEEVDHEQVENQGNAGMEDALEMPQQLDDQEDNMNQDFEEEAPVLEEQPQPNISINQLLPGIAVMQSSVLSMNQLIQQQGQRISELENRYEMLACRQLTILGSRFHNGAPEVLERSGQGTHESQVRPINLQEPIRVNPNTNVERVRGDHIYQNLRLRYSDLIPSACPMCREQLGVYRYEMGACFLCGQFGHFARECPILGQERFQAGMMDPFDQQARPMVGEPYGDTRWNVYEDRHQVQDYGRRRNRRMGNRRRFRNSRVGPSEPINLWEQATTSGTTQHAQDTSNRDIVNRGIITSRASYIFMLRLLIYWH